MENLSQDELGEQLVEQHLLVEVVVVEEEHDEPVVVTPQEVDREQAKEKTSKATN